MNKKNSENIRIKMIVLGYYQIIGGIIGLGLLIWLLPNLSYLNTLLLIIIIPAFIFFSFSIYCGILLKTKRESGIRFSIINQFLQLFSFAWVGYSYQYFSGLGFTIGLDLTNSFNFIFYFGTSSWRLEINTGSTLVQLEFNIAALFVIINLISLRRQIQVEKNKNSIENMISE